MNKIAVILFFILCYVTGEAQIIKGTGIAYFDSIPNANATLPNGAEIAYGIKTQTVYYWNRDTNTWESITSGGGGFTQEQIEDIVGAMSTSGVQTGIQVTYDDAGSAIDYAVDVTLDSLNTARIDSIYANQDTVFINEGGTVYYAIIPPPDLADILSSSNDAGGNNITNLADPINDQDAATKAYVNAAVNTDTTYDAGNGAIGTATKAGVSFARTSSTEGTFTVPDSVELKSATIHHTAAQSPGSIYYVQFDFQGTRPYNNDLDDIHPPDVRVANKYIAVLAGNVDRSNPITYNETVNSPNLRTQITGLSPFELKLSNYNDSNVAGANDSMIMIYFR